MEDHSSPSGTPVPTVAQGRRRRGSSTRQGVEGADENEDADDESSSSSSLSAAPTPQSMLDNFRQQWTAELKKLPPGSGVNVNSALNLANSSSASLANPYPNPLSMAGAVSRRTKKDPSTHHPFANVASSSMVVQQGEQGGANTEQEIPLASPTTNQFSAAEVPNSGTIEEQARRWFLQGVGFERYGDLYDAVRCYRKAVQLVPDIEYKISQGLVEESGRNSNSIASDDDDDDGSDNEDGEDAARNNEQDGGSGGGMQDDDDVILIKRFLKRIEEREWLFFLKNNENDKKGHIGDLPVEVISYILRWVVSSDLDLRSLDILSSVCTGLYCIARDDKLWQMACEKVWSSCVLDSSLYCSYRDMFLKRPRVRLDGCYISKITYIRPGEHSFQDQSYRPWHFVEYFRYFRFFPNGTLHFLTSSDEPNTAVSGLRDKNPKNTATLTGTYEMYGSNIISAVVTSPLTQQTTAQPKFSHNNKIKRQQETTMTQQSTSFHIELQICSVRNRHNWMLKWNHHAVFIKKTTYSNGRNARQNANPTTTITSSSLELLPSKYPPLLFSRVKSYTPRSEKILE